MVRDTKKILEALMIGKNNTNMIHVREKLEANLRHLYEQKKNYWSQSAKSILLMNGD